VLKRKMVVEQLMTLCRQHTTPFAFYGKIILLYYKRRMKLKLLNAIIDGLVKLVKAIRCRSACCQSSCNQPQECECGNVPQIKNVAEL
jgi:hypothetical protein